MSGLPFSPALDLELGADGWLTVWFNEPERRNVLTGPRVEALVALAAALKGRRDVRGVTFRGRGGFFCAGGDIKGFRAAVEGGRDGAYALSMAGAAAFGAVATLEQVTVMAIEGGAYAGGLGLAACGDLAIAEPGARFSLTEARIGVVPAQIAPWLLRRLGARETRRLMLTAATLDAAEAKAAGILDEVADDLDGALARVKATVLGCGPGALAATKALLADLPGLDRAGETARAAGAFADALVSEEGREGVASFLEKRKPRWAPGGGS